MTLADDLLASRANRVLYEADLEPASGARFQPTGFPDLGAALYPDPTGGERLLVESAQSMANRLEAVCWDEAAVDLVPELNGLPFVRVSGDAKTTSIQEAHRLNSPYVLADSKFESALAEKAGLSKGVVDRSRYAHALLFFDPSSLVHGSFMSKIKPGTARLERMLSAFIEAEGVHVAESGGVKVDRNDTSGRDAGGAAEGFGNVPFHRREYVAERILSSFTVDLAGIRGLRLPGPGARLVVNLALFKIRAFLDGPKRLRTACDLEVSEDNPRRARPDGFVLPGHSTLAEDLKKSIGACASEGLFANPPITEVTYLKKKKKKSA